MKRESFLDQNLDWKSDYWEYKIQHVFLGWTVFPAWMNSPLLAVLPQGLEAEPWRFTGNAPGNHLRIGVGAGDTAGTQPGDGNPRKGEAKAGSALPQRART